MKKRSLAIKSFLAVTALAWLGQGVSTDTRRDSPMMPSQYEFQSTAADTLPLRYSAGERALLRTHLRDHGADTGSTLHRGQPLHFDDIRTARTLPPHLGDTLQPNAAAVVDLIIGNQVVRLWRHNRVIIDLV
jgi:hypothetical protein